MPALPDYLTGILSFLGAMLICNFLIPKIIYTAKRKRLLDIPDNHRKIHAQTIPNLGGIAIFSSFIFMACMAANYAAFPGLNYFIAAILVLFVTGVKDDLIGVSPGTKFLAQFVASVLLVLFADIRLTSLHGFLGFYGQLPYWGSVLFSIVGCMFVTNAFNLIDGIDGLAGSIGILCSGFFGFCLYTNGQTSYAYLAFSLMGALIAFLRYNHSPARVFMGDTGALTIGFTITILSILFIETYPAQEPSLLWPVQGKYGSIVLALAILFVPVFDTFRVFTTRILKRHSPFKADRTHLHHYLLDLGFSHAKTVRILVSANLLIIAFALLMQQAYNVTISIVGLLFFAFSLFGVLFLMRRKWVTNQAKNALAIRREAERPHSSKIKPETIRLDASEKVFTLSGNKLVLEPLPEV
jgi:UDP-N-acetylmuramyl pentapeptide phosphotransferase/UDP-N-acetylglucosamine-1-phosphate transferase